MPLPLACCNKRLAAALFVVLLNALFMCGLGTSRKGSHARDDIVFNAVTLAAAVELFCNHRLGDSTDSEDGADLMLAPNDPLFVLE